MKINLNIERLVIDSLPIGQGQAPQLQAVIERELAHLLSQGEDFERLTSAGAVASIDGGAIHVTPGAGTVGLGKQIAAAVHWGFGFNR